MRKLLLLLQGLALSIPGSACVTCNKSLQEMIFDSEFHGRFWSLMLPFPLLGLLTGLIYGGLKKADSFPRLDERVKTGKGVASGLLIGMGLGGFLDGIILHQILQWHQMISNILPPVTLLSKQVNTFWDGIFHAFTWILTSTGIFLLFRMSKESDSNVSGKLFAGALIAGWGIFNAFDSIFNHYLFRLHNIREATTNPMLYNHVFLGFAIFLIVSGFYLIINEQRKLSR
ncbi:MAG: DUF2243 domain-containing protein [Cytophagaceae bacterium]